MHNNREKLFSVTASDCEWDYFRAGGPGGQNQNKRNTGVRVKHGPSGAVGEARDARTQLENRRLAWKRMASSKEFKAWVMVEAGKQCVLTAPRDKTSHYAMSPAEHLAWRVDSEMAPENIQVEVFSNGVWQIERK